MLFTIETCEINGGGGSLGLKEGLEIKEVACLDDRLMFLVQHSVWFVTDTQSRKVTNENPSKQLRCVGK